MGLDVDALVASLGRVDPLRVRGRVRALVGLGVRAVIPGVRVGEVVRILRRDAAPLEAEVVGFVDDEAMLLPLGPATGIGPDDPVEPMGHPLSIRCSEELLGRVLDGLGRPIDGGPPIEGEPWNVARPPPAPLSRPRIQSRLGVGLRAIDGLLTVGVGQRVGLFAGSGVGKSTLLGQIARQAEADVFVACLIGERGREVREFLDDALGEDGRRHGVVVAATSDAPALVRLQSAHVATAIAEWFRDRGRRVLLMMDSLTRFARAAREVGLAAGEPPARRGYPPSVFAALPALLERSGPAATGSITAFYTVLVEGSDLDEPVADEVRGILDGHIVLARELGARGRWPAIDVGRSLSRVMDAITTPEQRAAAAKLRAHLEVYEAKRDLVTIGAYQPGGDPRLDEALARIDAIEAFLRQDKRERTAFEETCAHLERVV
ncbi:MAG: FliI/YscN family ATPase [Myxococcota bacterium]